MWPATAGTGRAAGACDVTAETGTNAPTTARAAAAISGDLGERIGRPFWRKSPGLNARAAHILRCTGGHHNEIRSISAERSTPIGGNFGHPSQPNEIGISGPFTQIVRVRLGHRLVRLPGQDR